MDIKLTEYDRAMLFGLILLGRRYGDMQTSDWAAGFRDKLTENMDKGDEATNENAQPVN